MKNKNILSFLIDCVYFHSIVLVADFSFALLVWGLLALGMILLVSRSYFSLGDLLFATSSRKRRVWQVCFFLLNGFELYLQAIGKMGKTDAEIVQIGLTGRFLVLALLFFIYLYFRRRPSP